MSLNNASLNIVSGIFYPHVFFVPPDNVSQTDVSRPLWRGCRVDVSPTDVSPTDVSPTESSWMLRPLNKASLEYRVPDRCVPTLDRAPSASGA